MRPKIATYIKDNQKRRFYPTFTYAKVLFSKSFLATPLQKKFMQW